MKRIGLLALALILALGALGVGYATWNATTTVEGTVTTGKVQVGIRDTGTTDPGPGQLFLATGAAGFSADPRVNPDVPILNSLPNFVTPDKDTASCNSTNGTYKCAIATAGGQTLAYYASVSEAVEHAYPFYAPTIHLEIASCGCVPVKIDGVTKENIVDPDSVLACITWAWTIDPPEVGQPNVVGSGTLDDFVTALNHFQIEEFEVLYIDLTEIFLECTPQGKTASFDLVITASQWNEVGP